MVRSAQPCHELECHQASCTNEAANRNADAELLRLRAQTHTDADARRADIAAALEIASRLGASCHVHNLSVSNNRPLPRGLG
jgi:hypothetical protein